MTTIITRLYPDAAAAGAVVAALRAGGDEASDTSIITADAAGGAAAAMQAARVGAEAAAAYAGPVAQGRALLVVNAPFAPMGTALNAIRTVNRFPSIDAGLADEDAYIRDEPQMELEGRVFTGTVFFMSNPNRPLPRGHILGGRMLSRERPRTSAIRGGAYMSTKFWPMKLLSRHSDRLSVMRDGFHFSSLFGIPLLVKDWPPREDVPTILN
jgi:hypothetical protein